MTYRYTVSSGMLNSTIPIPYPKLTSILTTSDKLTIHYAYLTIMVRLTFLVCTLPEDWWFIKVQLDLLLVSNDPMPCRSTSILDKVQWWDWFGLLAFNGIFSINRLYCATGIRNMFRTMGNTQQHKQTKWQRKAHNLFKMGIVEVISSPC